MPAAGVCKQGHRKRRVQPRFQKDCLPIAKPQDTRRLNQLQSRAWRGGRNSPCKVESRKTRQVRPTSARGRRPLKSSPSQYRKAEAFRGGFHKKGRRKTGRERKGVSACSENLPPGRRGYFRGRGIGNMNSLLGKLKSRRSYWDAFVPPGLISFRHARHMKSHQGKFERVLHELQHFLVGR